MSVIWSSHSTALCKNIDKVTEEDKNKPTNTDEEQKDLHNYLVCHHKSVLLQTAKGVFTDIDESKAKSVRILFNSCSQSSYITEQAVKTLSLKLVDEGNITIKKLGKENNDKKVICEYEFKIKILKNTFSLFMKTLGVPNISDSINVQCIDVAMKENLFLRDLELADDGGDSGEIDVLTGADLYWLLRKMTGLVAIRSKFVWLVIGPVPRVGSKGGFTKSCLSTTHVLCLQNFFEAEAQLHEEIKKFWDLDSVGTRDDEVSVYEKHASETEFRKGQYEVGLPLKKNHPAVGDNFD